MSTEEERIERVSERFTTILNQSGLLEVRDMQVERNRATALCRLDPQAMDLWAGAGGLIEYMLRNEGDDWSYHIAKQYILQGPDRESARLVYGWCVSVRGENISRAIDDISGIVASFRSRRLGTTQEQTRRPAAPPVAMALDGSFSMPLPGVMGTRNNNARPVKAR